MKKTLTLWLEGNKTRKQIHKQIIDLYGHQAASIATQNRWMREYGRLGKEETLQDSIFQWKLLGFYDIPWQEGKLISYLESEYFEITGKRATGRIAKWLWRNWYLTDGANLTPHDDIVFFWKILIEKSIKDAEEEKYMLLSEKLNWQYTASTGDRKWHSKVLDNN
jgi:hypothetical protein